MTNIPLGIGGFLRDRNSSQRTAVLGAVKPMLDKGNDVVMREDLIWSDAQAVEGGSFDWTKSDAVVTAAANAGMRIWFVLSHPPAWATAPGASSVTYAWPCPPYADVTTQNGQSALAAYATFCGAAAARYAVGGSFWSSYNGTAIPVKYFEIWNEEYTTLASSRWNGSAVVAGYSDPLAYAAIYDAAAAAVHAVSGALPVADIADKIWNSDPIGGPYLDIFLKSVNQRVDVVSLHTYTLNYQQASYVPGAATDRWLYFTQVSDLKSKLDAANFGEAEIWITEMGWPTQTGGISEANQASRFSDLWTTVQGMSYISGLIIFCVSNPDYPDNSALSGYDANNAENFYALWHTGATSYDIAGAKPAVATITGLPAITRTDVARTLDFIKPTAGGGLPTNITITNASLPAKSKGTALQYLMRPIASTIYPASDITSYVTNTTAPTYSGAKSYTYNANPARFTIGGNLTDLSGYGVNRMNGADVSQTTAWTSYSLECYVKGTDVAFQCFNYGNIDYKVIIDDMPMTLNWQQFASTGASYIKLQFATSRTRKIRILFGFTAFALALTPSTGDIWPTAPRLRIAMTGDSYVQGSLGSSEGIITAGSLAGELAIRTGWEVWNLAQGGTGYQNQGSGTTTSPGPGGADFYGSASRLAALAALPAMDLVIVYGGANDGNYDIKKTVTRANSLWSSISAARPLTPLIVGGIEAAFPSSRTVEDALNVALRTAANAHPGVVAYIDQRSPQMWIDGTGNISSPTGDGNADIFVSSDTVHPTHDGWGYVADRLVQSLENIRI